MAQPYQTPTPITVHKFGGAALQDAAGLRRVGGILQHLAKVQVGPSVVVVSAMGKTTNALEHLANLATQGQAQAIDDSLQQLAGFHHALATELLENQPAPLRQAVVADLDALLTELRQVLEGVRLLGDYPPRLHDRIMAFGELLASTLAVGYWATLGLPLARQDARQLLVTDASHRQAKILWPQTVHALQTTLAPLLAQGTWPVVQGYIAATPEGRTTTLGREGSDFTAAVVAHALHAEEVTLWKDVPGILTANPKRHPGAQLIPTLGYAQALAMSHYGATVVHPNTLEPIRQQGVRLRVRPYADLDQPGTVIQPQPVADLPPVTLERDQQLHLTLRPRSLAYQPVDLLARVAATFGQHGLAINAAHVAPHALELVVNNLPDALTDALHDLADALELLNRQPGLLETVLFGQASHAGSPSPFALQLASSQHTFRPLAGA